MKILVIKIFTKHNMEETHEKAFTSGGSIEKVAFTILGLVLFLIPFFFIPSQGVFVSVSKGLLICIGVVLALALFIIALIKEARISLPKNLFSLSVLLLPVVFLISALVKGGGFFTYLGYTFELGTVISIVFGALLLLLMAQLSRTKKRVKLAYIGFLASFGIVALYQLIRLIFGANVLGFGFFNSIVLNPVGNWNDLAVFFGAATILSLVSLEMLPLKRLHKILAYVAFVVSLVLVAIIDFSTVWIALGSFALVFFLYFVSFDQSSKSFDVNAFGSEQPGSYSRKISWNSLAVLIIAFIFAFFGASTGDKISASLHIVNPEVRPNWAPTLGVIQDTLKASPLVGSGPNNFNSSWLMYKPVGVNDSLFWNIDFSYGSGLIPTFFATTGILGILSWVFFFAMFLWLGIKGIFYSISDVFSRYFVVSSFLVSFFFWVMTALYDLSIVNFALAFMFTGLFASSLYQVGLMKSREVSLAHHPKLSFISVLVLIVLLIGNISLGYLVVEKSISVVYFQTSLLGFQQDNNIAKAEAATQKAIDLGGYDIYYRGMSELGLARINVLLNKPGATPDSIRTEFQQDLASAIQNAKQATVIAPQNYQNWLGLAQVYAAVVPAPFSMTGAYESAKKAYEEALKVNPHNPSIMLLQARLEASKGDLKAARVYVNQAIAEKSNYAEAHFLLAQIEVSEGNIDRAITSLQTTLLLSPGDPGLYFQLGLLKYNNKDYSGAKDAFAKAVEIVPDYANAKYFLGLSLFYTGQKDGALAQFEDLQKTNPDNQELKLIISNLYAGKDLFDSAKPPVTAHPEKRSQLPLQQTN